MASPFLRSLPLASTAWSSSTPMPYAHPLDDSTAAVAYKSLDETAATLGPDGAAWKKLYAPLVRDWEKLLPTLLGPVSPLTKHPIAMANFGLKGLRSARSIAEAWFKGEHAKGLFAGVARTLIPPLEWMATSSFGLVLGIAAHAGGWPVARGGSQKLADAAGVDPPRPRRQDPDERPASTTSTTSRPPRRSCSTSPPANCSRSPATACPTATSGRSEKFRYGPGVHKIDWKAHPRHRSRGPRQGCRDAGTVHLGGTFDEVADAERVPVGRAQRGEAVRARRAVPVRRHARPGGQAHRLGLRTCRTARRLDVTDRIEARVGPAPGFGDTILARNVMNPAAMGRQGNANLVGGDITGGANLFKQVVARPVLRANPYKTPAKGLYPLLVLHAPGWQRAMRVQCRRRPRRATCCVDRVFHPRLAAARRAQRVEVRSRCARKNTTLCERRLTCRRTR